MVLVLLFIAVSFNGIYNVREIDPHIGMVIEGLYEHPGPDKSITKSYQTSESGARDAMDEVPGKVAEAYSRRDVLESQLDDVMSDPGMLCGEGLQYENHSSSYTINSGNSVLISSRDMDINGSLTISDSTHVTMENVSLYFNFVGTDPYITVTGISSLTLRNVTVDSDTAVHLYVFMSNISMENCYLNKLQGDSVILGRMSMDKSYIAKLEDGLLIDRSQFEAVECHINGTITGHLDFEESDFDISKSAISQMYGIHAYYTSSGQIENSSFYRNQEAIFSDRIFEDGKSVSLSNVSFMDNEIDISNFHNDLTISDCIFANSIEKAIGYSGDGRNTRNGHTYRDREPTDFILDNNIFYNTSTFEFTGLTLMTDRNIFYMMDEGIDAFNCDLTLSGDIFFNTLVGAESNTAQNSIVSVTDAVFQNWYNPFKLTNSPLSAERCIFQECYLAMDFQINDMDIHTEISHCSFTNTSYPITVDGTGEIILIDNVTITDCLHGIDVFDSNLNIVDALILTDGWNIRLEHSVTNAANISFQEKKVLLVGDCTLNTLVRMEIELRDFLDNPLTGVKMDVDEVGNGPSYTFTSDVNGCLKISLINLTMEGATNTRYDTYLVYHESDTYGYLHEEVGIENGKRVTLRIGFSDLVISSLIHSHNEPYHGMMMTSTVEVTNRDFMPAHDIKVFFYLDDNMKDTLIIPILNRSEYAEVVFFWTAQQGEQGGRYLEFHVDAYNEIYDSNETNNYRVEFIQVIPKPIDPVARLSLNKDTAIIGEPVVFNASASSVGTADIHYIYYFGDDESSGWINSSEVTHVYNNTGIYYPVCKVKDGYDHTSFNSSALILEVIRPPPPPKPPVAIIASPFFTTNEITVKTNITFSPAPSYSLDDKIVNCTWFFGDDGPFSTTMIPIMYRFEDDIAYNVTLIVTDSRGMDSQPAVLRIEVRNLPPAAVAESNVTEVTEGGKVAFKAFDTTDPDDDPNTELIFEWYFPNGTMIKGKQISYRFEKEGVYEIKLVVTDDDKATSNRTIAILVKKGNGGSGPGGSDKDEKTLLERNWLWFLCISIVILFACLVFIRTRTQSKKTKQINLSMEQKNLESQIRKKEIRRSYEEAERKIKERILSGERIDFTANEDELPSFDDAVDYYGLENVVEYDGRMGIGHSGEVIDHDAISEVVFDDISDDVSHSDPYHDGHDGEGNECEGDDDYRDEDGYGGHGFEEDEDYQDEDEYGDYGFEEDDDYRDEDGYGNRGHDEDDDYRGEDGYGNRGHDGDDDYRGEDGYGNRGHDEDDDYRDEDGYVNRGHDGDDDYRGEDGYGNRGHDGDDDYRDESATDEDNDYQDEGGLEEIKYEDEDYDYDEDESDSKPEGSLNEAVLSSGGNDDETYGQEPLEVEPMKGESDTDDWDWTEE